MNKTTALLLALFLITFIVPAVLFAGEEQAGIEKTSWKDLVSDIFGHYPLKIDQTNTAPAEKGKLAETKNWIFDFGLQRFIMSHTSYEIGTHADPLYHPLSRLEFPLNTWWLDFELRRTCPRWSVGGRAGLSVARNTDGRMKDSDWMNEDDTDMLTNYSESACRAEANYQFRGDVDVNIADWLRLPSSIEIRPLFAFQFQRLNLMAHDGVQYDIGKYMPDEELVTMDGAMDTYEMKGDSIHLRQDYYMYLIGLRGVYNGIKIGKYITIRARGEADWGPALAYYEDHHLQRGGDLFAYFRGYGSAVYFLTGLDMIIAKTVTLGVSMDYLGIRTRGVTVHTNIPRKEDFYWSNGVKTWSDQTSLTARVSYAF